MPAPSPLDVLAEEFGTVAGRIERESALRIAAAIADLQRRDAEHALAFERLSRRAEDVLSGVRPPERGEAGPVGPPGPAGARGEDGRPGNVDTVLPLELAAQVASAARLLHELPPIERGVLSTRVTRIERDEHGAFVPIYDEAPAS